MKRFFLLFMIVLPIVLLTSGCAAQVQQFADLPDATEIKITALVGSLLALGLNFLIVRVTWLEFLRKYQAEWSLSLSVALIAAIEYAIPDKFADIATKGIDFLLAVILLYVPFVLVRNLLIKRGVRGFAK